MERPILFSAPMVRAILEGRKTMTRRVVKPQPIWVGDPCVPFKTPDADPKGIIRCPYGQPGDRLWVRETWSACLPMVNYSAGGARYFPDDHQSYNELVRLYDTQRGNWRPSIFMPRWASRITLEVVGARVERLLEITESDAKSEGIDLKGFRSTTEGIAGREHTIEFAGLWDSINGKKHPWESNPWVWVIEFNKLAN